MSVVAGIDLGGTAINYTFLRGEPGKEAWLIDGLCEHPARSKEGPSICLQQIADGLEMAAAAAGIKTSEIVFIGLDTPGPASSAGVLSARGSTNFVHADWAGFDIREGLATKLGKPVTYLNDGNAGALWGHFAIFGVGRPATSISAIVGTGLGGGVIVDGNVVKGRKGFGGELGHVLIPYQSIDALAGVTPHCNCGRIGDLESVCSLTAIGRTLLPHFLTKYPDHELQQECDLGAGGQARPRHGGARRRDVPRHLPRPGARPRPLLRRDDQHVRSGRADRRRRRDRNRASSSRSGSSAKSAPACRRSAPNRQDIPIHVMPNGDTAGVARRGHRSAEAGARRGIVVGLELWLRAHGSGLRAQVRSS